MATEAQTANEIQLADDAGAPSNKSDLRQIVYCQASIKSVSEVDTITQTYFVEAFYKLRWCAAESDIQNWNRLHDEDADSKQSTEEFIPSWSPQITFPNSQAIEVILKGGNKAFFTLVDDKKIGKKMCHYDFQIRSTFRNQFDLRNFPFGCQGIHISMQCIIRSHAQWTQICRLR